MAKVTYQTKEECLKAIQTVKALGMEPADWMLEQLKAFEQVDVDQLNALSKQSATPIWDTLKKNYPYGTMPEEKKECIESAVNQLLETGTHAEEPGLLLGKIQCGKTDTFEDIIGLAFDKGVDIAIVITKGTKALVNQTIKRMQRDYRFFKPSDSLDQRATINIHDIMDVWKNLKRSSVEGQKTVIVSKKNAVNLAHLIDLFNEKSPYLKEKKVLIVDDEADFASRNYKNKKLDVKNDENGNPVAQKRETEMAKISQQIDDFRKIPAFCRYLQVTATPYSLYLQPSGELNLDGETVMPFRPRFTCLVPVHDKYIGGKEYFLLSQDPKSMYSHLYHQIDKKCIDVMGHEDKRYLRDTVSSQNIYGLTYALVAYIMATAIRRIQERGNRKKYQSSAVIHVEIDKKSHDWQKRMIEHLLEAIKTSLSTKDKNDQRIWSSIDINYKDFRDTNELGRTEGLISVEIPSKEEVIDEMTDILTNPAVGCDVQPVNSDEEMNNLLNEDTGELKLNSAANIFIGGNILDRGITIKNMLCFFYGRNPKNFQQDTVLQHARMYGARSKEDMAVTRLHTTDNIYRVLARMNELDEQLRKWFVSGKDKAEPNAVFVGYDEHIKPCAAQKIKVSNALTIKPQHRVVPAGFYTGTKSEIGRTVVEIDDLITHSPGYNHQDKDGFFEMDSNRAMEILKLIESTYRYKANDNIDRKNDMQEMMCNLEYCAEQSNGKIYVLHRTNRNMPRLRSNGGYIDAPDTGHTDTGPSRNKAIDEPVLMLLRENGNKQKDEETGIDVGWNNTPFYWPVFMPQRNIDPVMYAMDQLPDPEVNVISDEDMIMGLDPNDILKLTFRGDLVEHFGEEGSVYTEGTFREETRSLKEGNKTSLYILKDNDGKWVLNPNVPFDSEHDHGVYSLNNGVFPFVFKPYKYMLLRNGRTAQSDAMLVELADMKYWQAIAEGKFNEDGDLVDRDTDEVIAHGTDVLVDRNLQKKEFVDNTLTQWIIIYPIKKVLKFKTLHDGKEQGENEEE